MSITIEQISKLREQTGVGIAAAKKALHESDGNFELAIAALRKAGEKVAASKLTRATREGLIGHYLHANGKVASMVVVTCETDFVARNPMFQELVHDLALHVAATNPRFLKPEDVPADVLDAERAIYRAQVGETKKPAAIVEKIIAGKLEKFYADACLLNQPFVKDDSVTVGQLVTAAVQKLGENIQVREFVRFSI